MNKTEFKPQFSYYNPYKANHGRLRHDDPSLKDEKHSKIINLADSIIAWSGRFLHRDYEKQVDLTGKIANVLDWGTMIFVGAVETVIFADKVFPVGISNTILPKLSTLLTVPSASAFLGLGMIEGIVEFSNLQRMLLLHRRLRKHEGDPMGKLNWIKSHYFSLRTKESKKIQAFIDKYLGALSPELKALKFQKIADKILYNRFSSLKNRITPGLAKKVGQQLGIVMRDLESWNPRTRKDAQIRAEKLMESVSRQAKNKIVIHIIGLVAIGITLLSMTLLLTGATSGIFLIPLSILSAMFIVTRFLIEKGTLDREVDLFHKGLEEFKLPIGVDLIGRQGNPKAP